MAGLCAIGGLVTAFATGLSGLAGTILWWRDRPARWAWALLRAGQAVAVAYALLAGVRWFHGPKPADGLFYLYAVLPVAVAFVAEQLRLAAAETVLDQEELRDADEMRALPENEQAALVHAILRRELGVISAAALVAAFLALRAWGTAG